MRGLYSSHIVEWRRAERAEAELAKSRLVIEIQGKASDLLKRLLAESDDDPVPTEVWINPPLKEVPQA